MIIQKKNQLLIGILVLALGCKQQVGEVTKTAPASIEEIATHSAALNTWFEKQFQEDLMRSPMQQTRLGIKHDYGKWDDISSKREAEDLELAKRRMDYLKDSVNTTLLNPQTKLSYQLYKKKLDAKIADFNYRFYNYPVNQMHGMQAEIPAFMINMHTIKSKKDAKAYISRLETMDELFDQLIENLKLREKNGILPPKFVFEKILGDSRNVISGKPFEESNGDSALLDDFKSKLKNLNISEEEKKQLVQSATLALKKDVKKGYQKLISFLEDQQLRATTDDGAWKFPKGEEFYGHALKRVTTTNLTAAQIHQIGVQEVSRIHKEMEVIKDKVGFEGTLQDFFVFMRDDPKFYYEDTEEGKSKYLDEANAIINTMKSKLDKLFGVTPKADIVVKAVEPFREKSAGKAFYQRGTPDGSRPGKYYANLYDMKAMPKYQMEALAYHEGIPGHHMQISIAQELENIPKFRKYSGYQAYIEGWGLYNEYLPKEIGMYQDPYSDFGRLAMELWRACRLVVDTGIHAKKWTREKGIKYYTDNTPNAVSDAVKMVERHIVMPGQATAYKIGMNKILELRKQAKSELNEDFDIKEFHDLVLTNGPVPLDVLESLVTNWIMVKKQE